MNLGPSAGAKLPVKGFLAGVPMTFDAMSMAPGDPQLAASAAEEAVREVTLRGLQPFLLILSSSRVRLIAVGERGADIVERPLAIAQVTA